MSTGISGLYQNTKGAKIARGEKVTQTNYERIKAMSVEELAAALLNMHDGGCYIDFCKGKPECNAMLDKDEIIPDSMCLACMVGWLESEVAE